MDKHSQGKEKLAHQPEESNKNVGVQTVLENDFTGVDLENIGYPSQKPARKRVRALSGEGAAQVSAALSSTHGVPFQCSGLRLTWKAQGSS